MKETKTLKQKVAGCNHSSLPRSVTRFTKAPPQQLSIDVDFSLPKAKSANQSEE